MEAADGLTVAVSCCDSFFFNVKLEEERDTPVTGAFTVTVHVSVYPPFADLAVIVAVPADFAVTSPVLSTEAMLELLVLQVTVLLEAVEGATVAVSCLVAPTFKVADSGVTVTPLVGVVTVTVQVAVLPPSFVFAVIIVVPLDMAVICPEELTVATLELEELQV